MRIEINLIRERPKRRKAGLRFKGFKPGRFIKAPPTLLIALGGAAVLLMLAVHFYQNHHIDSLDEEIQLALADSASLSTAIQMIKDINLKKEEIKQRIAVVSDLDKRRYVIPMLMDQVSTAVPELTWLTKWTPVKADSSGNIFELEGVSFSNIRIAEFMIRLQRAPLIDQVTLLNIHEKIEEGISTMVFTLRCSFMYESRT